MNERQIAPKDLPHTVLKSEIGKTPENGEQEIIFALGCFWGAEKVFWKQAGVVATAVGYIAGKTVNPTYNEVCSGRTGHTEAVRVVFSTAEVSLEQLLKIFFEGHDPTQGNRQGNDVGSQYRSGIYTTSEAQLTTAKESLKLYERALLASGMGPITTEVQAAGPFYFAEIYHQQYLDKNPHGYCGLGGCGVKFPSE